MTGYMRKSFATITVALCLVALLPSAASCFDRIHINCPQTMNPVVPGDSIRIPVSVTNNSLLGGFHLGFTWNSTQIRITSIDLSGTALSGMQLGGLQETYFGADTNYVFFNWTDLSGTRPFAQHLNEVLLFALNAMVQPGASTSCITIDTASALPGLQLAFVPQGGGTTPEYVHCPGADIMLGPQDCGYSLCGDANGDLSIDISDAVFLLQYIFVGGPAPNPLSAGNVNCDAGIDIADAVYLILYIFSGFTAPCAGCK
jgi:hypothetical protein